VGALRGVAKSVLVILGLAATCVGALGLALTYASDAPSVISLRDGLAAFLQRVLPHVSATLLPGHIFGWLIGPWRFVLTAGGIVTLGVTLLPGAGAMRDAEDDLDRNGTSAPTREDRRGQKKARAEASRIAKKGNPEEAAELCIAVGLLDDAANYFLRANLPGRAAEIRHDQNRFLESAELYAKAGKPDSAGAIYAQQEKWELAAEAYVVAGNLSVAAEMYEKAGNDRRAAQCYRKCDFPRYAAKAYIRCEEWLLAAEALEQVLQEEGRGAQGDAQKHAEHQKLVRMTGNLFERGGRLDRALDVLAKYGAYVAAAEVAQKSGKTERAAELFLEGRDAERAAAAFEAVGQGERAARILADLNRDRGNGEEAARQFERAGEWMEAATCTARSSASTRPPSATSASATPRSPRRCSRSPETASARAELRALGRYSEAAELFALAGDSAREADLLEKAGDGLRAGSIHLEAGRIDEAIGALQKVGPEHADFAGAAALLGPDLPRPPAVSGRDREAARGARLARDRPQEPRRVLLSRHDPRGERRLARGGRSVREGARVRLQPRGHRGAPRARAHAARRRGRADRAGGVGHLRALRDPRHARPRRHGHRLQGRRHRARPHRRAEGAARVAQGESAGAEELPARGEERGAAEPSHIVTVYDAGEQDGVYYIAMEYVDGHTLKDIIKRRGKIAPKGIVHVVSQMCEALAYRPREEDRAPRREDREHDVDPDKKAKIMDFGWRR
jgi:tetratricopeptide (TPR) repeat protein